MNLISFSLRTKGAHNFFRRLHTVFTRFGYSEARIKRALQSIIDSLRSVGSAPTFFIPAVVLKRHPRLIAEIVCNGAEIGVHGYVHNDYRTLSKEQQFQQTRQAAEVFEQCKIPFTGFRNPYLGWTNDSLEVFAALGFLYESNIAVLHDVVNLDAFSPLLRSGFAKSLELFQAIMCSAYALRPRIMGNLIRIPTSIPDDEILFDRLRITDTEQVGHIWSEIMQRVYDLEGLYTLNLHPERGILCRPALEALLAYTSSCSLPVWTARIGEIARWWRERSRFRLHITPLDDDGGWRVQVNARSTWQVSVLARHLKVEGQEGTPWYGNEVRLPGQDMIVKAPVCPAVAVSQETPEEVVDFLYEQGYPVVRSTVDEAPCYSMFLDMPEGLGSTLETQTENKGRLVQEIESIKGPLLRIGCWPDGCRAALAISGDIDSVTIQDFFWRIVEVYR